jgi:Rieske Fe-S protein
MADETTPSALPDSGPMDRRGFLKTAAWILSGMVTLVLGLPVVWTLVGSIYRRTPVRYSRLASLAALPQGQPVTVSFQYRTEEAYLRQEETHDVWVIKHSPTEATVFSSICPHLGCHYDWDTRAQRFVCPCHASMFTADGTVLSGPAPRPLDTLPYRIENGQLFVAWERFEPGVPRKIAV